MALPRVAVLRGGMSNNSEVSMKTGAEVLRSLTEMGYANKDITITKFGEWLDGGRVRTPEQALSAVDTVFIALHGEHGEDGRVQRYLSQQHIPYTGSRALASATAFNKAFTKKLVQSHGIKTPVAQILKRDADLTDMSAIFSGLGEKLVLKPVSSSSSLDTYVAITPEEIIEITQQLFTRHESLLVEEYIYGKEVTIGVLEQFRDNPYYTLPPVEVQISDGELFYSYNAKCSNEYIHHCPARLSKAEQMQLRSIAETVHQLLDLRQYSCCDCIVTEDGVYLLEVNTLPALSKTSLFTKAIDAVGVDYNQLVSHLVANAHY